MMKKEFSPDGQRFSMSQSYWPLAGMALMLAAILFLVRQIDGFGAMTPPWVYWTGILFLLGMAIPLGTFVRAEMDRGGGGYLVVYGVFGIPLGKHSGRLTDVRWVRLLANRVKEALNAGTPGEVRYSLSISTDDDDVVLALHLLPNQMGSQESRRLAKVIGCGLSLEGDYWRFPVPHEELPDEIDENLLTCQKQGTVIPGQ